MISKGKRKRNRCGTGVLRKLQQVGVQGRFGNPNDVQLLSESLHTIEPSRLEAPGTRLRRWHEVREQRCNSVVLLEPGRATDRLYATDHFEEATGPARKALVLLARSQPWLRVATLKWMQSVSSQVYTNFNAMSFESQSGCYALPSGVDISSPKRFSSRASQGDSTKTGHSSMPTTVLVRKTL